MYILKSKKGDHIAKTSDDRERMIYIACGYTDITPKETPKTTVKKKGTKNGKVKSGTED